MEKNTPPPGIIMLAKPGENYHQLPLRERLRRVELYYSKRHADVTKILADARRAGNGE